MLLSRVSRVYATRSRKRDGSLPVSIFLDGYRNLGLDDGVDTTDLVCDLPSALEEQRVVDRSNHCDVSCMERIWIDVL